MAADGERFRADLIEDEGEIRVVVSGEVDVDAVPRFFAALQEADSASARVLIVVLDGVSLID